MSISIHVNIFQSVLSVCLNFAALQHVVTIHFIYLKPNKLTLTDFNHCRPYLSHFPLVADNAPKRALMPLFFRYISKNNKGIRARLVVLLAIKGNLINKGCNANAVRKMMLYNAELSGLGK
jgi:hypothetical protein